MSPIAPIPDVPEPQKLPRSVGLGRLAENSLVRFFVQVFNRVKDALAELLRSALERTLESIEKPLVAMAGPILDDVLDNPNIPSSIRYALSRSRAGTDQAGIIALAAAIVAVVMMLAPAAISGVRAKVEQFSYFITRPNLLDFGTWYAATLRNPAYRDAMDNDLRGQGWRDEQITAARLVAETRLGVSDILLANIRGILPDGKMSQRLAALGVAPADAGMLQRLTEQIPGPGDLVRFGLREAWRDDIAAKYGYDQGMPSQMAEWMKKQGFGAEWARAFWRAHWVVPSAGQMFEMFHRNEIDEGELFQGLKVNDIAPGWLRPLLGITYNLLTRVDVKRALRYGELSMEDVRSEYKKQGYDDRDSRILTNIAVQETVQEAAGLTRAAVVSAYKKRRLTRTEAIESLEDVGVLGAVAGFYLDQADADRADEILQQRINNLSKRFMDGTISESDVRIALGTLGVGAAEVAVSIESWSLKRSVSVRRPSRSNLDEFFKQQVIGVDKYRSEMELLGYDPTYVGWYLASLAFEQSVLRAKEEERAQKERLRVEKERKESAYAKAKAVIDQDIAELNAAIADAQVAVIEAQNERDRALEHALSATQIAALETEYKPLFSEVDTAIAQARLAVQTLQTDIKQFQSSVSDARRAIASGHDIVVESRLKLDRAAFQTDIARLARLIAVDRVDIAILQEAIPNMETPEQRGAGEQDILALQRDIREIQEQQAVVRISVEEIDEQLPVQLAAARRAEIQRDVDAAGASVDQLRLEIAEITETIRAAQLDRQILDVELQSKIEELPGRFEQIAIRAKFNARIDAIKTRIAVLRSNVAELRIAKTDLVIEWRT